MSATDIPDLSNVVSMEGMFYYSISFTGNVNMNDRDTSNVKHMNKVFQ